MAIKNLNKLFTWKSLLILVCLVRLFGPAIGMPAVTWPEVIIGVFIYILERKLEPKSIQVSKDGVNIVLRRF